MKASGEKGFTLLESLVALALVSLMGAVLYSTYFGLTRAREKASAGMESFRELRTTLDNLKMEIASVFFNRNNKRLHFIVEDRDSFGKPASNLILTTISPSGGITHVGSDLVEIKYFPREKEGKMLLTRQVKDVYLSPKPIPYPRMEELEGFLVECFDGQRWVRSWNTDLTGGLPKAVKVTIRIKDGGRTVDFSTISYPKVRQG
jgi:general secretion pathway protein J